MLRSVLLINHVEIARYRIYIPICPSTGSIACLCGIRRDVGCISASTKHLCGRGRNVQAVGPVPTSTPGLMLALSPNLSPIDNNCVERRLIRCAYRRGDALMRDAGARDHLNHEASNDFAYPVGERDGDKFDDDFIECFPHMRGGATPSPSPLISPASPTHMESWTRCNGNPAGGK